MSGLLPAPRETMGAEDWSDRARSPGQGSGVPVSCGNPSERKRVKGSTLSRDNKAKRKRVKADGKPVQVWFLPDDLNLIRAEAEADARSLSAFIRLVAIAAAREMRADRERAARNSTNTKS